MKLDTLKKHIIKMPGTKEDMPFGPDALVYKIQSKMFALIAWNESPLRITLKCDPDYAQILRDTYSSVGPGYYMNKRHWNTIVLNGEVPAKVIKELIDDSYQLVFKSLKKADREAIGAELL
ncbi:MAG: MmcQ/YjbR family DNA-binding protein [Pseudomonadales bacterium]|nr:MmcQ/YjbR family DNA-binding protein [Pseudomonadales bacterium]